MDNYWLVLKDNTVVNIVIWDGVSEWGPGEGLTVEKYQPNVNIGATKNPDGTFTNIVPEVIE
jgi:hypothetical protein